MTGFPINPPRTAIADVRGFVSPEWYKFFAQIQKMIGGASDPFQDATLLGESGNAKAQSALDQLERIADALELLASNPAAEHNNSVVTDYIDFDLAPPHQNKYGRLNWNATDQTLEAGLDYDVIMQIGQETYARVQNSTGSTIPNGAAVGFNGVGAGDVLSVKPYLADGSEPTLYVIGVMTHDLPDSGEIGYCTVWGHVRDIDTSAWSVGDALYCSPTVPGGMTNVKPTAPYNVAPMAAVLVSDATNGVIFVRPIIEQQLYYGEFTNSTGVAPAAANTAYALAWDNTEIADGVSIASSTRVTVDHAGLYQFTARMQLTSNSASTKSAWVWYKKNGTTDYTRSATVDTISENAGYLVMHNSAFFSLAAGDYVELMWAVDSTNLAPTNVAATAFAPSSPCALLEVTQIQQ